MIVFIAFFCWFGGNSDQRFCCNKIFFCIEITATHCNMFWWNRIFAKIIFKQLLIFKKNNGGKCYIHLFWRENNREQFSGKFSKNNCGQLSAAMCVQTNGCFARLCYLQKIPTLSDVDKLGGYSHKGGIQIKGIGRYKV